MYNHVLISELKQTIDKTYTLNPTHLTSKETFLTDKFQSLLNYSLNSQPTSTSANPDTAMFMYYTVSVLFL